MGVKVIKASRQREPGGEGQRGDGGLLRTAAYCRVSTDQEEQESSYEAQCAHYTEYIRAHPDYRFAGIYADEGISGTSTRGREGFARMLRDCEEGKLDLILTKSISRFARNTLDCLKTIRRLKELSVAVYFEKEQINTLDAKGEVLLTIMASIAQQESQSISQNVRMGIQYRFQQGKGRLNTARFLGLTRDPAGDGLVIVPEEAALVRRIFRAYLEGYSPGMIAARLTGEGIPAPAGGKTWYQTTVVSILENEKYAGDLLLQKYFTEDFLTHRVVRNTGQLPRYYVEDAHEPIVPREVFRQVQGELRRRAALKGDPSKLRFGARLALSGRLLCGRCGRTMKRYRKVPETETDWRCRDRASGGRPVLREVRSVCGCRNVRETEVQQAILAALNCLPARRDELIRMQERLRIGERTAYLEEKRERLERRLEDLETEAPGEAGERERAFLTAELRSLREEQEALELERADRAARELQVRLLLELADRLKEIRERTLEALLRGEAASSAAEREEPPQPPACRDYEDFFRRTRYRLPEELCSPAGEIVRFDNDMVIRYLDHVTVLDDGCLVCFKAGPEIGIGTGKGP